MGMRRADVYERHADRMRQAVLLGEPGTKRTEYFRQAARQEGMSVSFLDWKDYKEGIRRLSGNRIVLKIDPPRWESCLLKELNDLADDYKSRLEELAFMAKSQDIEFFNHPSGILLLLDKKECKKALMQAKIPVTESLDVPCRDTEQLLAQMESRKICQVFIKPVKGSGAAGVSAFRIQPKRGRMVLYTCAFLHPQKGPVNTKRLRCFSDPEDIFPLLTQILETDCIVERWYAKARYGQASYDLRAVVQEGKTDFLLARLSEGPITNLHLNNRPLALEALKLPGEVQKQIADLCKKAMDCYPQLRSAGIDILLERGSLKPRIIEMNGQGDLIYQDIYADNLIYRRQVRIIKRIGE